MLLIESVLVGLLVVGLASGLDFLIVRSLTRFWKQWFALTARERGWRIRLGFVKAIARLCIWGLALWIGVRQVPQLEPVNLFLQQVSQTLWGWFLQAVNLTLIDLGGGSRITLITLFAIIGVSILIFGMANVLGRWIKQKVLSQTRIARGSQEAIATLISYVIAVFGFIILLQSMGLNLSSLTVFAGVIGIGFGLGLQELAKNFVSGLALLFEQQLRVGDYVEVDGVEGTIEEISIRSTILRTQDRLYVVVPNQRFFENNVTNWSYKSQESRIHIPVSVAYGTDTLLLTEALVGVARQEPKVLKYPAPQVWFKSFGESSLDFELLVWINQPQDSLPIKSSINFAIDLEFRRRNIAIPFPQREIWLNNSPSPTPVPPSDTLVSKVPINLPKAEQSRPLKKRNLRQLLRGVSYFSQCTNAQLLLLIEQGFRQQYGAQEVVFREQESGECFYLILSGVVEVYSDRLDHRIATLATGDFFGEISLFTGIARSATVRTLEETTLFVVDRRALKHLMQDYGDLAEQIAQTIVERKQALEEMGLTAQQLNNQEQSVFSLRDRIKTLFGI
ncbi:MAG: mechanosensitive ion channel domain-containing protein [Cyanobacteria bacterium P01_F01_bin.42]